MTIAAVIYFCLLYHTVSALDPSPHNAQIQATEWNGRPDNPSMITQTSEDSAPLAELLPESSTDLTTDVENAEGNRNRWNISNFAPTVFVEVGSKDVCGGALIAPKWIVTAAHCMREKLVSSYKVYIGSNEFGKGQGHEVEEFFKHKRFNSKHDFGIRYDIALLKLKNPIMFDDNTQYMSVYNKWNLLKATDTHLATLHRWKKQTFVTKDDMSFKGGMTRNETYSVEQVQTSIMLFQECRNITEYKISEKELCSITETAGNSLEGSPIIFNGSLAGVLSSNLQIKTVNKVQSLQIWTRISSYLRWIVLHAGRSNIRIDASEHDNQ